MSSGNDPQAQRAAARVGEVLRDKYRLERVLGVGGMAAVYLGVHRNNGNRVAVKVLRPELSHDPDVRARFLREGYAANSIGHPGAVRVLDDDVAEDGSAFLVMELVEGETLLARAERLGGKLDAREALPLVRALLDVLAAAHDKGIVHRDIKPENLFITTAGDLRVLDFGIARVRDAPSAAETWAGAAMGTPAFMPPEQALGRTDDIDARTDLWAVGATLFTLLSGRFVHEGKSGPEMVVHAATRPAPSLGAVMPEVPEPIVAVVDRALRFARAERWESAKAMAAALDDAHRAAFGSAMSAAAIGAVPRSIDSPERRAAAFEETAPAPAAALAPVAAPRAARSSRAWLGLFAVAIVAVTALVTVGALRHRAGLAPVAGAAARCKDNRGCAASLGGKPGICRKDDGQCVALGSDTCTVLAGAGDIDDDATIWIGAMFPTSGPDADSLGVPSREAIALARRDFAETAGGLPPARAGGPKRPLAVVACDDARDPSGAARHLVDDLHVPVVIGFARSREVADLASSIFVPRGVLTLASNTASMLRSIPSAPGEPRLVYRTTMSGDAITAASAALTSAIVEPAIRAEPGVLAPGEPLRVALVHFGNVSGTDVADAALSKLRFNGKTVTENGPSFRQVEVPESGLAPDDAAVARVATELAAFRPHLVVDHAELIFLPALERRWPAGVARPRYVSGSSLEPAIRDFVREHPEVAGRILTLDVARSSAAAKFVLRHNEVFARKTSATNAIVAPYDAFYVAAYALVAIGETPITGRALASAIARLVPPGEEIDVGPAGIYPAFHALEEKKNIDLGGAATTLDFDPKTGDAATDIGVFCATPDGVVPSGLVYRARDDRIEGRLACR